MDMDWGNQGVPREFGFSCKVSRTTNDDGTSTSQALIKNTYPHPIFENEQLTFMPDVSHLLKNIHNHLTRGKVIYLPDYAVADNNLASNSVSITFIKEIPKHDSLHSLKIAPHLSEKEVDPGHFHKMEVSLDRNLLWRKTGAALRFLMQEGVIGHSASATAWFCDQIGLWYDLMTSRSTSMGLSLFDMKKHAEAVTFLESIIKLFTVVKIGSETKPTWKPVQSGTILATKTSAASHKRPLKTYFQWWGSITQFPQHWNWKTSWELLQSHNESQGKQHHRMKLMTVNNALQSWIFHCHQHLTILYFLVSWQMMIFTFLYNRGSKLGIPWRLCSTSC